ncbi:carbohydrate porin [Sphingomonas sp. TREG-RG-20F-R18-01]|uniref:carbohydrate porin n=1 Tax=Sphingomonas sp. TREG-RG-20F-R18-01 TaxID=2914982 RepID=UPI001F5725BC|nr:carbohydrate porin [Sphingomonas sp. TREG-RG-20F-R18-01]
MILPSLRLLCRVAPMALGIVATPLLAQAGSSAPAGSTPVAPKPATPDDSAAPERFALHAQFTFVGQAQPAFRAAADGSNSLRSGGDARETTDFTVYAGARPWKGAELWINPEIDQGFGLANTLGAAGFPSGEAYKVGKQAPYFRLQRLFLRQTIGLGGASEHVAADLNQLGGDRRTDRLVLTFGKISVGDVFDTNSYAHDPRGDFLNWTVIEAGAFDYAADAWGYTTGGTAELYRGRFAVRAGLLNLSTVPNSERIGTGFRQYELVGEIEERHQLGGQPGKIKLTAFANHGLTARLDDAVALSMATGLPADPALVRRFATRAGLSLNLEQAITPMLGVFARAGFADGRYEAFEFTDVDRSVSGGVSLAGGRWGRVNDRVGVALVVNAASQARQRYLAAGGLGILVGDGGLARYGSEDIVELYYDLAVRKAIHLSADVQAIDHPAYNRDRGPVAVLGLRLHGQI